MKEKLEVSVFLGIDEMQAGELSWSGFYHHRMSGEVLEEIVEDVYLHFSKIRGK